MEEDDRGRTPEDGHEGLQKAHDFISKIVRDTSSLFHRMFTSAVDRPLSGASICWLSVNTILEPYGHIRSCRLFCRNAVLGSTPTRLLRGG